MKTQIQSLINGAKEIRRDVDNPKYLNAPRQTTGYFSFVGTNRKIRQEIADAVIAENPDGMDVEMFGVKLRLNRESSLSGKTVWFSTEISLDNFMLFSGYAEKPYKNECSFVLMFNNDMTVEIQMFARRNEKSQWRHRSSFNLDESFVTIL